MIGKNVLRVMLAVLMLSVLRTAHAAESTLTEEEAVPLHESEFADIVNNKKCIVMYYTSEATAGDAASVQRYEMTLLQRGDAFMRSLLAFRGKTTSSFKLYKVNWKDFSERSLSKIRGDVAASGNRPDSPSFVSYGGNGSIFFRTNGVARPDTAAWFINEIVTDHVPSVKTTKGEFLYEGWAVTDDNDKDINLVDVRAEVMDISGRTETVRINSYRSNEYDGLSCTYDKIYTKNGNLLASVETCGKYGKVGYFDHARAGKMQYRLHYDQSATIRAK